MPHGEVKKMLNPFLLGSYRYSSQSSFPVLPPRIVAMNLHSVDLPSHLCPSQTMRSLTRVYCLLLVNVSLTRSDSIVWL